MFSKIIRNLKVPSFFREHLSEGLNTSNNQRFGVHLCSFFGALGTKVVEKTDQQKQHQKQVGKVTRRDLTSSGWGGGRPYNNHPWADPPPPCGQPLWPQGLSGLMNTPLVPSGHGGGLLVFLLPSPLPTRGALLHHVCTNVKLFCSQNFREMS